MEPGQQPGRGLEAIVGTVLGFAEVQRIHYYANHHQHILGHGLERWYANNSGDLFQGFGMALGIDIASEYLASWVSGLAGPGSPVCRLSEYVASHHVERAFASAVISSGVVAIAEVYGILNYPLLADIPAGVAGALLYAGVRCFVVSRHHRQKLKRES
jgi:hypothetical protein